MWTLVQPMALRRNQGVHIDAVPASSSLMEKGGMNFASVLQDRLRKGRQLTKETKRRVRECERACHMKLM